MRRPGPEAALRGRPLPLPTPLELLVFAVVGLLGVGVLAIRAHGHAAWPRASPQRVVLDASGSASGRLQLAAANLAPGGEVQRSVDVVNRAGRSFRSLDLTTMADRPSLLVTDRRNGLQLRVERCSRAWAYVASSDRYECRGRASVVAPWQPVLARRIALPGLAAEEPGAAAHLRVSVLLPLAAGSQFAGLSTPIDYAVHGEEP